MQQKPVLPLLLQISRVLFFLAESNYRDESWLLRMSEILEELAAIATEQQDELLELMVEAKCMVSFLLHFFVILVENWWPFQFRMCFRWCNILGLPRQRKNFRKFSREHPKLCVVMIIPLLKNRIVLYPPSLPYPSLLYLFPFSSQDQYHHWRVGCRERIVISPLFIHHAYS